MKTNSYTTLQKTYDQSHLTCSTAVYYENQGNEVEALRCWRDCLSQLQGHNASPYRPRTETEKALLQSLKTMQDQCQDRVGFLQAILVSRVEAENSVQGSGNTCDGGIIMDPIMPLSVSITTPPPPPPLTVSQSSPQRFSRTPSPEKRAFLSTLRPVRRKNKRESSPKVDGAAATKAAALAWASISRAEGATHAHTLAFPSMETFQTRPRPSVATSTSTTDQPMRQWSPSTPTHRPPTSPPHSQERPRSSYIKLNAQSSAHSCPVPLDFPFAAEAPIPRLHRHLTDGAPAVDLETPETHHNKQVSYQFPELNFGPRKPPTPPPKVPPKPGTKPPRLSHLNPSIPQTPISSTFLAGPSDSGGLKQSLGPPSGRDQRFKQQTPLTELHAESPKVQSQTARTQVKPSCGDAIPLSEISIEGNARVARALESISKGVDMQAALQVANEIVIQGDEVHWDDVAGLDAAKLALKEAVVYPFLRPDLFSGLREPARGMLLFGPPGTGKTMLARAVATESRSTFFSISASSLTSKYLGESEKLVRALFALAKALAPSIIFVDEIDSLLSSRSGSGEHEATRRIKTEFLIQWSDLSRAAAGNEANTGDPPRVLVLAATNLPWAIDDAARRRFVRRQYVPLPEGPTRGKQLLRLLSQQKHQLSQAEIELLIVLTDGFSGSDITALAKDAAMGPLRSLGETLLQMKKDDIRPITFSDFKASLSAIRPSVSKEGLQAFEDWAKQYGERV